MNKKCSVYRTADLIGKRWTLLILLEIYKGRHRYSELKRSIPEITGKILSLRLKELVDKGMVKKKLDASVLPVKSEYTLTPRGKDFINIIKDIKKWALKWNIKNKLCENQDCDQCGF